ncbi:phosphotransferase [Nonomuraea sp. NPDC050394]|uniref:phosphotransferase n=1 Tax=Nonomuraea sp. NPDC050394 TaxID=3364363 RepID=UPI0037B0FE85
MDLIGKGRTADVFALSPTKVLRRYRDGDTALDEARVMEHVRAQGYPVPEVFDATETDLVMTRLHGPTMFEVLVRKPWKVAGHGRLLGRLHDRLHAIEAPDWLDPSPGDRVLHLDLHPLNVIMTPDGPSVIDWCNAAAGEPAFELATTYLTLRTSEIPITMIKLIRRPLARALLRGSATDPFPRLADAAAARLRDPHTTPTERVRLRRLL